MALYLQINNMFTKIYSYILKFFIVFLFSTSLQAQSLRCLNLFKESLKSRSSEIIISYIKNPSQLLIKESLRLEESQKLAGLLLPAIKGEFKDLTIFGKLNKILSTPNQLLTKAIFQTALNLDRQKRFSIAPLHFLKHNIVVRPVRFITRKSALFNREYEPSTLLSSLAYGYYFYQLVLNPIKKELKDKAKKEIDFLILKDYRYASLLPLYNQAKALEDKIKSKDFKAKEIKQLQKESLFMKSRVSRAVFNKKYSYDIFFSDLLKTKKGMLSDLLSEPLSSTENSKKAIAFLKALSNKFPTLFLERDQWSNKSEYAELEGFVKVNKKITKSTEQLKNIILIKLVEKHIHQEIMSLVLYFNKAERAEFVKMFPWAFANIVLSPMYKKLETLQGRNTIAKGQFLRSMQEFIQWKFNFSVWKDLGLQPLVIEKNLEGNPYYTNEILTLEKIKKNILKEVENKSEKKI